MILAKFKPGTLVYYIKSDTVEIKEIIVGYYNDINYVYYAAGDDKWEFPIHRHEIFATRTAAENYVSSFRLSIVLNELEKINKTLSKLLSMRDNLYCEIENLIGHK